MTQEYTLESITDQFRQVHDHSPDDLSKMNLWLAAEFSLRAAQFETIKREKPTRWTEMRKKHSSDKQADREWEQTNEGKDEIFLRFELKRIDKLSSAIRSRLRVKEIEAKTLY